MTKIIWVNVHYTKKIHFEQAFVRVMQMRGVNQTVFLTI